MSNNISNPFIGTWTYRSLLNDPNPATAFNDLQFGLGTIVLLVNVICLGGYTLGCHSMRHLVGGMLERAQQHDDAFLLARDHHRLVLGGAVLEPVLPAEAVFVARRRARLGRRREARLSPGPRERLPEAVPPHEGPRDEAARKDLLAPGPRQCVEGQDQGAAYPHIVERLLPVVDGEDGLALGAADRDREARIALELLEDLPDVETVVIPWGGGGLSCGIAAVLRALAPKVRIYAAEIETAAPLAASLAAGEPRTVEYQPSFVDGIGSKTVFPNMFEHARTLLDGSLVVTLKEAAEAYAILDLKPGASREDVQGAYMRLMDDRVLPELEIAHLVHMIDVVGVRAEGDIGGYIWLPQWIGGRMHVNEIWKRC